MCKLYVSYIPKVQGETPDFKIIKTLKKCMAYYSGCNNIISSPGYLSNKTHVKDFVKEFKKVIPAKNKVYIGYFKGMNKLTALLGVDLIDKHYKELVRTGKFIKLKMNIANKADHRKMMFIYGINENPTFDFEKEVLNKSTKDKFLRSITVNAILIGSSNQSYSTYFGGAKKRADKGEADILLFVPTDTTDIKNKMYVEGTVVFEEVIGANDPHDYLKDILKEFLSRTLV